MPFITHEVFITWHPAFAAYLAYVETFLVTEMARVAAEKEFTHIVVVAEKNKECNG